MNIIETNYFTLIGEDKISYIFSFTIDDSIKSIVDVFIINKDYVFEWLIMYYSEYRFNMSFADNRWTHSYLQNIPKENLYENN